jgi:hypothetical protein
MEKLEVGQDSRAVKFSEVESIRCPKCASGPNCKCWVMAGRGVTTKTKLAPHLERAVKYFEFIDKQAQMEYRTGAKLEGRDGD